MKTESEEDTLPKELPKDLEQGMFLNRSKKDDCKRRPSLAQKMTSNLRRFSGAQNTEHKIDISEPSPTNNPKFCHKKIKVSGTINKQCSCQLFNSFNLFDNQRHSIHGMMEEENVIRPHQEIQALTIEEKKFLLAVERGDVAGTRRYVENRKYKFIWEMETVFISH